MANETKEWNYSVIIFWVALLVVYAFTAALAIKGCQLNNELNRELRRREQQHSPPTPEEEVRR